MELSAELTAYIYIKAWTQWGTCDFAIINVTQEWLDLLDQRLEIVRPYQGQDDLYALEFWDAPLGYFIHTNSEADDPLDPISEESPVEWYFADLDPQELEQFCKPGGHLQSHKLVVLSDGQAVSAQGEGIPTSST